MEHRCGTRYEVDVAAYACTHGGVVSCVGWLRNVSVSGGLFRITIPVGLFSRISLRLVDPDGNFGRRVEGRVVRRTPEGVGIEWDEYERDLIQQVVEASRQSKSSTLGLAHPAHRAP